MKTTTLNYARAARRLRIREAAVRSAVARGDLARPFVRDDLDALLADPPTWLAQAQRRQAKRLERQAFKRAAAVAHDRERHLADPQTILADAYLRACKDGGDTDYWAATTLHAAGVYRLDDGTPITGCGMGVVGRHVCPTD